MVGGNLCRSDSCPKSLFKLFGAKHHACFFWFLRGEDWLSNLVLDGSTNSLGIELLCKRNASTVFEFFDDWNMESTWGIRKSNYAKCLFVLVYKIRRSTFFTLNQFSQPKDYFLQYHYSLFDTHNIFIAISIPCIYALFVVTVFFQYRVFFVTTSLANQQRTNAQKMVKT